jgi:hypothetical protein
MADVKKTSRGRAVRFRGVEGADGAIDTSKACPGRAVR